MKKKTGETKGVYSVREIRLTVRISDEDKARIQRLRSLLSPYSPLSEGKTISAALALAEKHFKK